MCSSGWQRPRSLPPRVCCAARLFSKGKVASNYLHYASEVQQVA